MLQLTLRTIEQLHAVLGTITTVVVLIMPRCVLTTLHNEDYVFIVTNTAFKGTITLTF